MRGPPKNHIDALCRKLDGGVGELAEAIGVSRQCVYSWISGEKKPGPDNRSLLHELYGIDIKAPFKVASYQATTTGEAEDMEIAREMVKMIRETNEHMSNVLVGRVTAIETTTSDRLRAIEDRLKLISESVLQIDRNSNQKDDDHEARLIHLEERLTFLTKKLLGDVEQEE